MKRALALCLVAGCASTSSGDTDDSLGTPENPAPFRAGAYHLVTRVDLTAEAVLPAQAELIVSTLRLLSTNPARALITSADQAGVPAVGTLFGLLPGPLKSHLEGWINDELGKVQIGGQPVTDYAGQLAHLADLALSRFAIDSELTIHDTTTTHRLTALDLTPTGLPLTLPITGLAGDLLTQQPTFTVGERGALTLGAQHFGLNYGEYAWQAIEAVSRQQHGTGIRDTLGRAISCPDLARSVANKCLLTVCVGHASELTSICEGGLDAIVDFAHNRLADLRLDTLHLATGQATLIDDDGDGLADRLTDGTWAAELDLGLGLRHTPATFTGAR